MAVVTAANSLRAAGTATGADDGDGRAGEADLGGEVLDDDTEEAEDSGARSGASGGRRVAALDRASRAGARRLTTGREGGRGGGRKEGEGEGGGDGELGEHLCWLGFAGWALREIAEYL